MSRTRAGRLSGLRRRCIVMVFVLAAVGACDRTPSSTSKPGEASSSASDASQPTFRDWPSRPDIDPGETDVPPVRIVSAAPNLTEICCALGLEAHLVGRTRYCTHPASVSSVPEIGALIDGSVEALLALKPDVVLVSGTSRALAERLAPLGLRVESLPDRSLGDLFTTIVRLGERFQRPRTAARLVEGVRQELDRAAAVARHPAGGVAGADEVERTALLLTGTLTDPPRPPFVAGPGSFFDELLTRAGLRNVVTDSTAAFAPVSLEFILARDPSVIFELDPANDRPDGDASALAVWSKLGTLSAVRKGRVHVLRGGQHYILGPRIAQTLAAIGQAAAAPPANDVGGTSATSIPAPARGVEP